MEDGSSLFTILVGLYLLAAFVPSKEGINGALDDLFGT